jgi:hypothetical protein
LGGYGECARWVKAMGSDPGMNSGPAVDGDSASHRPTDPDIREGVSARCDHKRGLGAVYGVPALAGRVLPLEGGPKHFEIHG